MEIKELTYAIGTGIRDEVCENGIYTYGELFAACLEHFYKNSHLITHGLDYQDGFHIIEQGAKFSKRLSEGKQIQVVELISNLALNTLSTAALVLAIVESTAVNLTPACRVAAIVTYVVDTPFKNIFSTDLGLRWDARTKFAKNSLRILQNVVLLVIPGSPVVVVVIAILAPVLDITANTANSNAVREYKKLGPKPE